MYDSLVKRVALYEDAGGTRMTRTVAYRPEVIIQRQHES